MIDGGNPLTKMLGNIVKRYEDMEKRVARLETLEYSSFLAGGWVEIETVTVNASVNLITINNIPDDFLHLFVMINSRTDSTMCDGLTMIINNDAGNSYWYHRGYACDACTLACLTSFTGLATSINMGSKPGASFAGTPLYNDIFGVCTIWIPDYRCIYKHKSVLFDNYWPCADGDEINPIICRTWGGGTWHSNAAITRLDFPVRFIKNSKISVYGIGGTYECHA